jgi:hypothetical protein
MIDTAMFDTWTRMFLQINIRPFCFQTRTDFNFYINVFVNKYTIFLNYQISLSEDTSDLCLGGNQF